MNFPLHLSTEGSISLKIQSFLVVQMLQAMRMIIFMKKGTPNCCLMQSNICGKDLVGATEIPMEANRP
jgi:hypothetical protein